MASDAETKEASKQEQQPLKPFAQQLADLCYVNHLAVAQKFYEVMKKAMHDTVDRIRYTHRWSSNELSRDCAVVDGIRLHDPIDPNAARIRGLIHTMAMADKYKVDIVKFEEDPRGGDDWIVSMLFSWAHLIQ